MKHDKIRYIINHISNSSCGKRYWFTNTEGYTKYWKSISTFPWYVKFAYLKKPKNWYMLSEDEQSKLDFGYHFNTKDIIRILTKELNNKKLTTQQQNFMNTLFENFTIYENQYYEENLTYLFNEIDMIEMIDCPF